MKDTAELEKEITELEAQSKELEAQSKEINLRLQTLRSEAIRIKEYNNIGLSKFLPNYPVLGEVLDSIEVNNPYHYTKGVVFEFSYIENDPVVFYAHLEIARNSREYIINLSAFGKDFEGIIPLKEAPSTFETVLKGFVLWFGTCSRLKQDTYFIYNKNNYTVPNTYFTKREIELLSSDISKDKILRSYSITNNLR